LKKKQYILIILIISFWFIFTIGFIIVFISNGYSMILNIDNNSTSAFGAIYGGVLGTIFSLISILLIIYSIFAQNNYNKEIYNNSEVKYLISLLNDYLEKQNLEDENKSNRQYFDILSKRLKTYIDDYIIEEDREDQIRTTYIPRIKPYTVDGLFFKREKMRSEGLNENEIKKIMRKDAINLFFDENKKIFETFFKLYKILLNSIKKIETDDINNGIIYKQILISRIEKWEIMILKSKQEIDRDLYNLVYRSGINELLIE